MSILVLDGASWLTSSQHCLVPCFMEEVPQEAAFELPAGNHCVLMDLCSQMGPYSSFRPISSGGRSVRDCGHAIPSSTTSQLRVSAECVVQQWPSPWPALLFSLRDSILCTCSSLRCHWWRVKTG
ncbi:uncharacterized protein LOC142790148 [Rhipicephalus microplus]|uniref:uncharacterized protein LOC142790148 n=1 Tax=Rhipicephalus microplus TaxID=6941 RepID=UPI003F6B2DE6